MVKMLILRELDLLSDDATEYQILNALDAKAIWHYRNELPRTVESKRCLHFYTRNWKRSS